MSDLAFDAMMGQIDDFSLIQKMALIRALKKSVPASFFHKKSASRFSLQTLLYKLLLENGAGEPVVGTFRFQRLNWATKTDAEFNFVELHQ